MTSRTHSSWNCMHEWTKSRFKVVVTSYCRNKNRDDGIKNQEKANNSPSYRFVAIKNSKNQSETAACEQKSTIEKANFFQTPFSHSTLKLERKKFKPRNHSLFRSTSLFDVTKITTPNWLQNSAPIQFIFFELYKNHVPNNSPYRFSAIKHFKIRAKKIQAAKPLAFSLHFLIQSDQNHYSKLTSKQRPNTVHILWIV